MSTAQATATNSPSPGPVITTVAGTGASGPRSDGGPATSTSLSHPQQIAVDGAGNLYIAEFNGRISKVAADRTITTVAGPGTSVSASAPRGVAVDGSGNLYIADTGGNYVRKIATDGTVTTVAGTGTRASSGDGGPATSAQVMGPWGLTVDGAGNLYIAEPWAERVRKVDANGTITTVAGTGTRGSSGDGGPAISAQFYAPRAVAVDGAGNLYIADSRNERVRKVDANGTITTVAGTGTRGYSGDGGPAKSAQLCAPQGLAVDRAGNLYIADSGNDCVRKVAPDGTITTEVHIPGSGGGPQAGTGDMGSYVHGIALDSAGSIYLADTFHPQVRKIAAPTSAALPASGTVVSWRNVRSTLRMSVINESVSEGAEVRQALAVARNHQRWRLLVVGQDNGDNLYTIENVKSGKVLEVLGAQTTDGAKVVQRTYAGAGARHQQWKLIPVNPTATTGLVYEIMNWNSGLFLRVDTNAAAVIKQSASGSGDKYRQWELIPV
ncbi:RICIN domain-containing protein [Streptomyces sp. NPDC017936]|uniref:NHL domain-containing protein n=1 Tax=Streptomyces sp. NPDC017936 TaxID=3365016 RepID=UPI0037B0A8CE